MTIIHSLACQRNYKEGLYCFELRHKNRIIQCMTVYT